MGLHIIGEQGPELMAFCGGEKVWTASQTRGTATGAASTVNVAAPVVKVPQTMQLVDTNGCLIGHMRVIAKQDIAADQAEMTTLQWGKPA